MYDPKTQSSHTHPNPLYHIYDRNLAQNYANSNTDFYGDQGVVLQFMPNHHQESMESENSGVISPPLWQNTPCPQPSPTQPLLGQHNYRSTPPNSRAEAIARAQLELMEMVKNMPESSYELTLKDIVEHAEIESQTQEAVEEISSPNNKESLQQNIRGVEKVVKREEYCKKNDENVKRNGRFDIKGLILKMVLPFSLLSNKKKKSSMSSSNTNTNNGIVISTRVGSMEREWWKKKFRCSSTDSESSRASTISGSSWSTGSSSGASSGGSRSFAASRKKSRFLRACSFLFPVQKQQLLRRQSSLALSYK